MRDGATSSREARRANRAVDGGKPLRIDVSCAVYGSIAMVSVAVFAIICVAVQFLRTDLNWVSAPMSIYTLGPHGTWVVAAFFALAPSFAAVGLGWHRALRWRKRSGISLALFIAAAVGVCLTAAFVTDTTPWPVTLHGKIHQWGAFAAFVCVTSGMTLQSWWLRIDPYWRKHFPDAFVIAAVTIVYFWVYALFHPIPRGLGEKVVIGLIALWIWRAAWWLVRGRRRACGTDART